MTDPTRYHEDIKDVSPTIQTRSGETLHSRLIRPDDAEGLVELVAHLSTETARRRFHQSVAHLAAPVISERAQELADVDNLTNGGAVLALKKESDGTEQIVGVARLGRLPGKPEDTKADAAIVVRDDYQGQGVGTELLRRLVLLARQMNVKQMVAMIESDNSGAIRLFQGLGLPTQHEISLGEVTLTIEMPDG